MILLDTHIWVWWVDGSPQLTAAQRQHVEAHEASGLGVSVISCWEVAKLVELNRLVLRFPIAPVCQITKEPSLHFMRPSARVSAPVHNASSIGMRRACCTVFPRA